MRALNLKEVVEPLMARPGKKKKEYP